MSALSNKIHQVKHYMQHVWSAHRKGHGVHSPFVYRLCEEVFYNKAGFYDFYELNAARMKLRRDETLIEINDLGAGSAKFKTSMRKVADIAKYSMSTARKSEILYRLINFSAYKNALELGTSLGLNAHYLARATQGPVYSFEGSEALLDYAEFLFSPKPDNLHFILGNFDEELPGLLREISSLDFAFIDGNHTKEATLRYFEMLVPKMSRLGVIVVDDIYWSPEMTRAWQTIQQDPRVKMSVDLFYFGLLFFREEIKEKQHHKMLI